MTDLPPPGWYDDPEGPGGASRWWDGAQWTEERRSASAAAPTHVSDEYPPAGQLVGDSFKLGFSRAMNIAIIAAVAAIVTAAFTWFSFEFLEPFAWDTDGNNEFSTKGFIAAVLLFIGTVVGFVAGLAQIHQVLRANDGEDPSLADSWAEAAKSAPRYIGWSLVTVGVAALWIAILVGLLILAVGLGVMFFVLSIPVAIWAGVAFSLFPVAVVDGPGNPFRKSLEVTKGRWWGTFGRLLLLGLALLIPAILVGVIGGVIANDEFANRMITSELSDDTIFNVGGLFEYGAKFFVRDVVTGILSGVVLQAVFSAALAYLYRTRIRRSDNGSQSSSIIS